jgi:two-component system, NtrC family, sensor kinase
MKLVHKLVLGLVAGILFIHAASAILRVQREVALLESDIARDERVLGIAMAIAVERTWSESGERAALDLIEHTDIRKSHLTIRWVPPDADGEPAELIAALERGEPRTVLLRDEDAVRTFTLVDVPDGGRGAIDITELTADESEYVRGSIRSAVVTTLALIVLSGLIAWWVAAIFVGRPIHRLVDQARRIGAGDLSARVPVLHTDEVGDLSAEMNRMADSLAEAREQAERETKLRLAAVAQLRHADRLTTVGTLAAGIAHELGTPINVITGYAQLVVEDAGAESAHESARIIGQQADRITSIVRQLLDFARRGELDGETPDEAPTCDVGRVARETLSMLEATARKASVTLSLDVEDTPLAALRDGELQQVLTNLTMNAIHAMPEGGHLSIQVRGREAVRPGQSDRRRWIQIEVADTGLGMPPETMDRVFEPFFTTKEVGKGTGLGLAVAWGIVCDRGGWIDVDSEPGKGTRFTLWLPETSETPEL